MKLSTKHEELLNGLYPDGYKLESALPSGEVVDESDYFHILFVKIIPQPGQHENKLVPMVQKMTVQDWRTSYALIEKYGIGAITQKSEFAIIHDPTVEVKVEETKEEAEPIVVEAPTEEAKPKSTRSKA